MIKQVARAGILFFLLSSNAFAEFAIYTIDNEFEAVFPANPQFAGELGEGKQKHRSYNFTDEGNLVCRVRPTHQMNYVMVRGTHPTRL